MGSPDRLFNRERTVHEILGGGLAADLMLWRRKNLTVGISIATLACWVVFEISKYTLLSFVSAVFLLLFTILFLWAKSAAILNRPAPSLPRLYVSEETSNGISTCARKHLNEALLMCEDIALGRDIRKFFILFSTLLAISVIGSLMSFFTFCYTCLVIVLTLPAIYERYEDYIDTYMINVYRKLKLLYMRCNGEFITKVHKLILETKKLS